MLALLIATYRKWIIALAVILYLLRFIMPDFIIDLLFLGLVIGSLYIGRWLAYINTRR